MGLIRRCLRLGRPRDLSASPELERAQREADRLMERLTGVELQVRTKHNAGDWQR